MIIGGDVLRADLDFYRLASIVGARGTGKDLLSHELAMPYLSSGYKFYSNQLSVWNDPLFVGTDEYFKLHPEQRYKAIQPMGADDMESRSEMRRAALLALSGIPNFPDVRRRVVVLSEGGRYLRKYEYFEDLLEFARKLKMFFFFPSVRPGHADLMTMTIFPIVPFKQLFGIEGGLWGWSVDSGYSRKRVGKFIFLPDKRLIGVYDTSDFTETPDVVLKAVKAEITIDQITRGRNGIQTVGAFAEGSDVDYQATITRRFEQSLIALQAAKR